MPLPFIDEHSREVEATPDAVWEALGATLRRGPGGGIIGFHVERAERDSELALAGRHPFSVYRLVFRIEDLGGGHTRLRAHTSAAFPGLAGRVYRALVIGTGAHVLAVRRLLGSVARRAEAARMSA